MTGAGLPPGWEVGRGCVVRKPLEDFKYAEVHYDSDTGQYELVKVDVDGPLQRQWCGDYPDLGKAMQNGDLL